MAEILNQNIKEVNCLFCKSKAYWERYFNHFGFWWNCEKCGKYFVHTVVRLRLESNKLTDGEKTFLVDKNIQMSQIGVRPVWLSEASDNSKDSELTEDFKIEKEGTFEVIYLSDVLQESHERR